MTRLTHQSTNGWTVLRKRFAIIELPVSLILTKRKEILKRGEFPVFCKYFCHFRSLSFSPKLLYFFPLHADPKDEPFPIVETDLSLSSNFLYSIKKFHGTWATSILEIEKVRIKRKTHALTYLKYTEIHTIFQFFGLWYFNWSAPGKLWV